MSATVEYIRSKMLRPTKRVEWSYSTSPNANYFHKPDGCWTVELVEHEPEIKPGVALWAFDTLEEARRYADTLTEPWDRITR